MASKAYPVPLNGVLTPAILPWRGKGIRVVNNSNVPIVVRDDIGQQYNTPPGEVQSFNSPLLIVPLYGSSAANGTGWATVTFSNVEIDPSANQPTQQPFVSNVSSATMEALLAAIQTLIGTTNTNTGGTSTNTGSLITLINTLNALIGTTNTNTGNTSTNTNTIAGLITTLNSLITTSNSLDTDIKTLLNLIEGHTGILTGWFPANTPVLAFVNNVPQTITLPYAITRFGFTPTILDGFLSIWYTAGAATVYQMYRHTFGGLPTDATYGSEKVFSAPVPSGGVLHFLVEQSFEPGEGVVRY